MKKRILIFTPGGIGGAERICITIGNMLPIDRFDVQYVILGRMKQIFNIIPKDSNVDVIPFWNKYCFSLLRIWWKIIRSDADVVFTSQVSFNPRVIIASKLAGKKVVVRSSGMVGDYRGTRYQMVKWTYPYADIIIAQQEEMRQQMANLLNISLNKIITLFNPIHFDDIESKKESPSPFQANNRVNFVNVARINRSKGQDCAIRAMAIVRKNINNAHLYFVGAFDDSDTYYRSLISLIEELQLKNCIHFIGYERNPFRWMMHCDCFVFPSRLEGLPNALVEASYLGSPCAATRCLQVVDSIIMDGYNGYTCAVDDVNGLANAMQKAIKLQNFSMTYKPSAPEEFIRVFDMV